MSQLKEHGWLAILVVLLTMGWMVSPGFAASSGSAVAWSKTNVKEAQRDLQSGGYYHGKIDGIAGPQTRAAIRQYQKAENLPVTGRLNTATANKLGMGPSSEKADFRGAKKSVVTGGKEFGHAMAKGRPAKAGKELGKSVGHASKETAKGVKKALTP
ncbi:MAG: peptidoglycan-binding domain-containing protein [Terriglobia bacterium]